MTLTMSRPPLRLLLLLSALIGLIALHTMSGIAKESGVPPVLPTAHHANAHSAAASKATHDPSVKTEALRPRWQETGVNLFGTPRKRAITVRPDCSNKTPNSPTTQSAYSAGDESSSWFGRVTGTQHSH